MKLTIMGIPRTKKNSPNIFFVGPRCPVCKRGSKALVHPSSAYRVFEAEAVKQIKGEVKTPIKDKVNIKCVYYLPLNKDGSIPKRVPDLTNLLEATDDILVKAGIVEDDNVTIIAGHDGSRAVFSTERARTEIEIEVVTDEQ